MEVEFTATCPSTRYKYSTELLASSYNSGVGAHGEKIYNLDLEIPSTAVIVNFRSCRLFSCQYALEVTASLPGCNTDLDIATNVGICHIPYPEAPPVNEAAPPYSELQEPSFGEAVGMSLPQNSPGPSTRRENEAPTASLKIDLSKHYNDSGTKFTNLESPPPTYEDASKHFT